jgi:dihydroorotase
MTLRVLRARLPDREGLHDVALLDAREASEESFDAHGAYLLPGLVDLSCEPGFPGFPVRETSASLTAAALAGGFTDLVLSPAVEPVRDLPEQITAARPLDGDVRAWFAAALTPGLRGEGLSEFGSLRAAGAVAISDGGLPVRDTLLLRNAMDYARGFGVPLLLRPADPDLDALGVVHESPVAARMGLRGQPVASEEIGVERILALVRATGARVHLTQVGGARAVDAVRRAQREGLPVTASVPARSLLLDEDALDDGTYDTRLRLHPPLRSSSDRRALIEGVLDGTLLLGADHQPRAPEEKELEFERAVPGSTGLETALAAAWTALGDVSVLVRAFSSGPRALLGVPAHGVTLFDPDAEQVVDPSRHRSLARNDALAGRVVRGRVTRVWPGARRGSVWSSA